MGKILGSWSGMRKYLEQEMLAESLRGRVRYGCTAYVGMDGCHIFEICIDGLQIKRFSLETVNTYFIDNGYKEPVKPMSIPNYWDNFWELLDKFPLKSRTEYTDAEFSGALKEYRNQKIQVSINSENPLVRMFAVLDKRLGKNTLKKVKETITNQPEWLQTIYRLRIEAELI
ncbi:MAG: hypothetical protein J1E81_02985 [Eubacterium sp.]|nr:hypothetical protein [Eubacterium sp.]